MNSIPTLTIYLADNLEVLPTLSAESVALIYIDPPFSTGKVRRHTRLATTRDEAGDRVALAGAPIAPRRWALATMPMPLRTIWPC